METVIDAAVAQQPLQSSDHDRVLLDNERSLYGVFDGAGSALASDLVLNSIRSYVNELSETTIDLTPSNILADAQKHLLNWIHRLEDSEHFGDIVLTTASLVHIKKHGSNLLCLYASAGDSPIYHFSETNGLTAIAEDENDIYGSYFEISNFLGSAGHKLTKFGEFKIEPGDSVAIVSDGVCSKQSEDGVDDNYLTEVLSSNSSAAIAASLILNKSNIKDDKSVVVIKAA